MPLSADLGIDYTNRRIYATGTMLAQFYNLVDVYSYLMDTFDDAGQMDDTAPMSAETPFDYTMRNGWYCEQTLTKNFRGGTLKTVGYNGAIRLVTLQSGGYTSFIASDIGKQIQDDGVSIGALLDFDNAQRKIWVRATGAVATGSAITTVSGTGAGTSTGASATGEEQFSCVRSLGDVAAGNAHVMQNGAVLTPWWGVGNSDGIGGTSGNHIEVLIKIREAGTEIDSGVITVFNRNYGYTYDHTVIDLTSGGITPAPLATSLDINNATAEATIAALVDADHGGGDATGVLVEFGTYTADVDDDGTDEDYEVQVDCAGLSLAEVYEALKWLTDKDRTTATMLDGAQGRVYISANTSYAPVKAAPLGTFAGGKLFGARGVVFINMLAGDASNFVTIDNDGNQKTPPATVTIAVTGLVSGDRVFQARVDGSGNIVKNQFTLAAGNNSGDGDIVVQETIPNDTPATGVFRIYRPGSFEHSYAYTSYNRSTNTFILSGTLSQSYLNTDNGWVPFIDEAAASGTVSKSIKYVANRDTKVRVRNGSGSNKIVPFEVATTIGSTGSSVPAVRIADAINNL